MMWLRQNLLCERSKFRADSREILHFVWVQQMCITDMNEIEHTIGHDGVSYSQEPDSIIAQ
jgi:hypothetical protein